jgi:hypothetical protein
MAFSRPAVIAVEKNLVRKGSNGKLYRSDKSVTERESRQRAGWCCAKPREKLRMKPERHDFYRPSRASSRPHAH